MISSRKPPQLSINHERWLVSYADFITLLFAFFVVMYSVSQINEAKFRVLSDTLLDVFQEPKKSLEPIQIGEQTLSVATTPIAGEEAVTDQTLAGEGSGSGAFTKDSDLPSANSEVASGAQPDASADAHFNDIEQALENRFANLLSEEIMSIESNEFWLEINLNANTLFGPATAEPSFAAETVFDDLADILKPYENAVEVSGYTDNQAINTSVYPSNWELSSARAAAIVQIMAEGGVAPTRMAAIGYGEFKPIASNADVQGRAKNRRVVVRIAKQQYQLMLEQDKAYQFFKQQKAAILADKTLSASEKNEQLVALGAAPVNPSMRQALTEAANIAGPDSGDSATAEDIELQPVRLKDGNILFTNDPGQARDGERIDQ